VRNCQRFKVVAESAEKFVRCAGCAISRGCRCRLPVHCSKCTKAACAFNFRPNFTSASRAVWYCTVSSATFVNSHRSRASRRAAGSLAAPTSTTQEGLRAVTPVHQSTTCCHRPSASFHTVALDLASETDSSPPVTLQLRRHTGAWKSCSSCACHCPSACSLQTVTVPSCGRAHVTVKRRREVGLASDVG